MSTKVLSGNRIEVTAVATYNLIQCAGCHITFALDADFEQARRDDHQTFYCPWGHTNYYPEESAEERLRKRLVEKNRDLDGALANLRAVAQQRDEAVAEKDRIVTRAKAGVCPHCNRSFKALASHMRSKHGTKADAEAEAAAHKA